MTTATTTGVGAVTIKIDDQKKKTYVPDEVTPDSNNNIVMTLESEGSKQWVFKDPPITINNPADFSWSPEDGGGTVLTVTDTNADKSRVPQHNYTVHVKNNAGEEMDIDPKIVDR